VGGRKSRGFRQDASGLHPDSPSSRWRADEEKRDGRRGKGEYERGQRGKRRIRERAGRERRIKKIACNRERISTGGR
jgi:hypothetical protein